MPKRREIPWDVIENDPILLGKVIKEEEERDAAKVRREMLLDLANLGDSDLARFQKRWEFRAYFSYPGDPTLLDLRNQLRKVWTGDRDAISDTIHLWVRIATLNNRQSWLVGVGKWWWVHPNYRILPLTLAIGVSDFGLKMTICANPECPQPYFLKGRKTQRFCDRPACSAFGQREHKRNWWRVHKADQRPKRNTRNKRLTKSRGK